MLPDIAPVFDKTKLFAGIFFQNSHFDDSGISLHAFLSITNLELHSIPLLSKIAKKYFTFLYIRGSFTNPFKSYNPIDQTSWIPIFSHYFEMPQKCFEELSFISHEIIRKPVWERKESFLSIFRSIKSCHRFIFGQSTWTGLYLCKKGSIWFT